jgi:hypothetical protein
MEQEPLLTRSLAYRAWLSRVESLVRSRHDLDLVDLPALALDLGFDSGDTPTEFYVTSIMPLVTQGDVFTA